MKLVYFSVSAFFALIALSGCLDGSQAKPGFGIYLEETGELVLSDEDIISYNKNTHEIRLTESGINKINSYSESERPSTSHGLYQKPFVVKLNGEELYEGAFWSGVSSLAYSGIVITDVLVLKDSLKIEAGYTGPGAFEGPDPRNNPALFDYFQKNGKLIG